MSGILNSLLGKGINEEELSANLMSILSQMQKEKQEFKALSDKAAASGKHLQYVTSVGDRVTDLEKHTGALEKLIPEIATVQRQAEDVTRSQRRAEKQLANATSDAERIQQQMAELKDKLDSALTVKSDLSSILELERPLKELRSQADNITGQFRYLSEGFNRIRDQHDNMASAQKQAISRLESFDHEYQRLAGGIQSTEKRVNAVEQAVENLAQIAPGVRDSKHQLATLKSLTDQITQKLAGLEQQREAVERATAQGTELNNVMRQFDTAVQKHRENAKTLSEYEARAEELKALHGTVLERSAEITARQREIEARDQATRAEVTELREDTRKSIERFEFEKEGIESVSQRVADLRSGLANSEKRLSGLEESNESITDIRAKADTLSSQLGSIASEISGLDEQANKARSLRLNVEELDKLTNDVTRRVGRIEAAQPAVEYALRDVSDLSRSHEAVTDALEKTQLAHSELTRMREEQAETQSWLSGVERSMNTLRDQVKELSSLRPTVEFVRNEAKLAIESTKTIESRREVVGEMHKQIGELSSVSARLDDSTKGLMSRMALAEGRFAQLSQQSEEAERISKVVSTLGTTVTDAEQRIVSVGGSVEALEQRAENLEALSVRVRRLGHELDQRQGALEKASEHLEQASTLRQEAAATAQELGEQLQNLTATLASTEKRAERMTTLAENLENRSNSLRFVEKRMVHFEERLAKWELAEADVSRALDQVAVRQSTIDTLKADIKQMFERSERTVEDVRSIAGAQDEVKQARVRLDELLGRFKDIDDTSTKLEYRKRQTERAEERLARVDAMLIDLQATFETLQNQKTVVDHSLEKFGSLSFEVRQAESLIQVLREERELIGNRMRAPAPKQLKPPLPQTQAPAKAS